MTIDEYAALVAMGFISLDVITGVIGSWGVKNVKLRKNACGLDTQACRVCMSLHWRFA